MVCDIRLLWECNHWVEQDAGMQSERAGCRSPVATSATYRAIRHCADGLARYLATGNSVLRHPASDPSCIVLHLRGAD